MPLSLYTVHWFQIIPSRLFQTKKTDWTKCKIAHWSPCNLWCGQAVGDAGVREGPLGTPRVCTPQPGTGWKACPLPAGWSRSHHRSGLQTPALTKSRKSLIASSECIKNSAIWFHFSVSQSGRVQWMGALVASDFNFQFWSVSWHTSRSQKG